MKARTPTWSSVVALSLAAAAGCGPGLTPRPSVSGSVNTSAGVALIVSLEDSSPQPWILQTTPDEKGAFSFDVTSLRAPYLLTAEVISGSSTTQLYSMAGASGTANVTADTTAQYERTSGKGSGGHGGGSALGLFSQLSTVLAPLFSQFSVTFPLNSSDPAALQALLQAVQFSVSKGTVTVTNRQTGGVIFIGELDDLSAGTFYPENLPQPLDSTACTYTYSAWGACQQDGTQSRTVVSANPAGCTGTPVLTQSCSYTAPACTYTYSAWGACQPDGTQSRTVVSAAPTGCTGTPVLTQSCSYTTPNPVTFSGIVSNCTSCHGLTSNNTVFKAGGYTVVGRTSADWLTTVNRMVRIGSSLPSGATAQNVADYLEGVP